MQRHLTALVAVAIAAGGLAPGADAKFDLNPPAASAGGYSPAALRAMGLRDADLARGDDSTPANAVSATASRPFDWPDAGIGAAGALVLLGAAGASVVLVRRGRRHPAAG